MEPISCLDILEAIDLIKPFVEQAEGLELIAYQDLSGVWTIGYGHTSGVHYGMMITKEQADVFLTQDLMLFTTTIVPWIVAPPTVSQLGAMVSLAYNIGAPAFKTSTVLREHNKKNFSGAGDAFLLFDKAHVNGKLVELAGLKTRREAERKLYLTGVI